MHRLLVMAVEVRVNALLFDDEHALAQGQHLRPWEKLGAHPCTQGTQAGTVFAVWAPNASAVYAVGDWNGVVSVMVFVTVGGGACWSLRSCALP